jgi:hypothetical protein
LIWSQIQIIEPKVYASEYEHFKSIRTSKLLAMKMKRDYNEQQLQNLKKDVEFLIEINMSNLCKNPLYDCSDLDLNIQPELSETVKSMTPTEKDEKKEELSSSIKTNMRTFWKEFRSASENFDSLTLRDIVKLSEGLTKVNERDFAYMHVFPSESQDYLSEVEDLTLDKVKEFAASRNKKLSEPEHQYIEIPAEYLENEEKEEETTETNIKTLFDKSDDIYEKIINPQVKKRKRESSEQNKKEKKTKKTTKKRTETTTERRTKKMKYEDVNRN